MSSPTSPSLPAPSLEFFFDCSSPWTYLGFERIQPLAAEVPVEITWKPILVGGIFNQVNQSVYLSRDNPVPAKKAYMTKDLQDWARFVGIRIAWPPTIFPVNSVKAMRGCILAARDGRLPAFARAVFEAYWGENRDISQDAVLLEIAARVGMAAESFASGLGDPAVKAELKANTDEAITRGAFGSPTIFVNGSDMYFGNDRLPLVRAALGSGGRNEA